MKMNIVVERDDYSAPFFDGCARSELLLRHCPRCGTFAAPAVRTCARCGIHLEWKPANGQGKLVTWSSGQSGSVMVDLGADHALYSISVTSELTGVNPQMLRV